MTLDSVVSPQVLSKYLILVDMKSKRFKYQSRQARDEAKKHKSPTKSERVGIYVVIVVVVVVVVIVYSTNVLITVRK